MNLEPPRRAPLLANGDRMKQAEFHRLYELYDEDTKIELVGGIVYMSSPLSRSHSDCAGRLGYAFERYAEDTPGVEVLHNATTILGEESEPQPDLGLRVLPEFGGRSWDEGIYVGGAAELFAEIAYSSRALDLHAKLRDYRAAGVLEYLVVLIEDQEVRWFHFPSDSEIRPNRQGIAKSRVFPGLWIDVPALLRLDSRALRKAVEAGSRSKPHASFVRRLQAAHRRHRPPA
jgi:Uma2 family endonuclease